MRRRRFDYAVAISFAGEDREYAESLALELTGLGISVFYDEYERALLWGKDLSTFLASVYRDQAQYCVMLVSKHYLSKVYPVHERKHAIERQMREMGEDYILPIKVDGTELPDLPRTIGYQDLRKTSIPDLARLLKEKIQQNRLSRRRARPPAAVLQRESLKGGPVLGVTPRDTAIRVLERLAHSDLDSIAYFIHPEKGVTLSLYAYVGQDAVHLCRKELMESLSSARQIHFGYKNGSGFEARFTLAEFLGRWLKAEEIWKAPTLLLSLQQSPSRHGNTIDNLLEQFPHALAVEAYTPGTPEYGGMDWRAIRMALEESAGLWYIVALVADMWTI